MDNEHDPGSRQGPLPHYTPGPGSTEEWPGPVPGRETATVRTQGLRRVRRISNWTAAALVVGTGATAVALAHNAIPVSLPANSSTATTPVTPGTAGTPAGTSAQAGPQVGHTVATTSASGVTTTTTTRVVNGKTVVTQVRHVPPHHDD